MAIGVVKEDDLMDYVSWRAAKGEQAIEKAMETLHVALRWEKYLMPKIGRLQDWVAHEKDLWTKYVWYCSEQGIEPNDNACIEFSAMVTMLYAGLTDQ